MHTSDSLTNETENKAEVKQTRKQYEKTDALLIYPLLIKLGWTGDGTSCFNEDRQRQKGQNAPITLYSISIRDVDRYSW